MKLVVNTLLGIGMAIAEAVALGEKAGLNRIRLLGVVPDCSGRTCVLGQTGKSDEERLQPSISDSANEQGFRVDSRTRECRWRADARSRSCF